MVTSVPDNEEIEIEAGLNGHIGDQRDGFEREHGGNGYWRRNNEGTDILRIAQEYNIYYEHVLQ